MSELAPKTRLVYLVHGYLGSPTSFSDVCDVVRASFPPEETTTIVCRQHEHGKRYSVMRAGKTVARIIDDITTLTTETAFDEIILAGHSTGAALLRRVFAEATNLAPAIDEPIIVDAPPAIDEDKRRKRGPLETYTHKGDLALVRQAQDQAHWVDKVTRIVLISGIGRGWSVETETGLQRVIWSLGAIAGFIRPVNSTYTLFDLRLGSPFIVQS